MAITKLVVTLDDETTWEVVADQRDAARWEMQFNLSTFEASRSRPVALQRYLAWSAGRREKKHTLSWDEFIDKCVTVVMPDDDTTGVDAEDPGQTAA